MTATIDTPTTTTPTDTLPGTAFRVTFLGLAGPATALLHRLTDTRLVTATATITDRRFTGRTVWLHLLAGDGARGLACLDLASAMTTPADHYASGRHVRLVGVARTHRNLAAPYIAVRQLAPVPAPQPVEETFLLRYSYGPYARLMERTLTRRQVDLIGPVVMRAADRGHAWNIEVLDADGLDVTDTFECFVESQAA
ncbi:hypothetical protein [Kitasatospora griseola]|uniref:hypothetical protein n=1 Tax=Kitasatospora griseola TaxID=2064 RepID=UPI00167088BB|nr:hypothetical protein [Kitasatospora griseola]GGR04242.1 hypothetical protein GCM10010195_69660 [Kitasatospora griseola]